MNKKCIACGGDLIEGTLAGMYVAFFYPKDEEKKLKALAAELVD